MSVQPTLTCQVVMFGGTVVSSTHITQAINPEHLLGHGEPKQLAETKLCALGYDFEANETGWLDSIKYQVSVEPTVGGEGVVADQGLRSS